MCVRLLGKRHAAQRREQHFGHPTTEKKSCKVPVGKKIVVHLRRRWMAVLPMGTENRLNFQREGRKVVHLSKTEQTVDFSRNRTICTFSLGEMWTIVQFRKRSKLSTNNWWTFDRKTLAARFKRKKRQSVYFPRVKGSLCTSQDKGGNICSSTWGIRTLCLQPKELDNLYSPRWEEKSCLRSFEKDRFMYALRQT